jgi:hypothetical protein
LAAAAARLRTRRRRYPSACTAPPPPGRRRYAPPSCSLGRAGLWVARGSLRGRPPNARALSRLAPRRGWRPALAQGADDAALDGAPGAPKWLPCLLCGPRAPGWRCPIFLKLACRARHPRAFPQRPAAREIREAQTRRQLNGRWSPLPARGGMQNGRASRRRAWRRRAAAASAEGLLSGRQRLSSRGWTERIVLFHACLRVRGHPRLAGPLVLSAPASPFFSHAAA